jgi:hypothetical protein
MNTDEKLGDIARILGADDGERLDSSKPSLQIA